MFNLQQHNKQCEEGFDDIVYAEEINIDKRDYRLLKSFITTSNTNLLRKFLESERERLKEYKYDDPVSQGEYSGHAEGHNFILDKIISQYQSLLETLK